MSWTRLARAGAGVVAAVAIVATMAGCVHAPQASSFELLGILRPPAVAGRNAVILGWAREARAGWVVERVRIDGRVRPEWDPETQRPAVFYLRPGARVLKIYSRRGEDGQLVRSRAAHLEAVAGQTVVCAVRVEGAESPLPRLSCEPMAPPPGEAAAPSIPPRARAPEPEPAATPADAPDAQRVLERLQAIEDRLGRLEALLRARLPEAGEGTCTERPQGGRGPVQIDTVPPW